MEKRLPFKLREKTKQTKRTLSPEEQKDKAAGRWIHRENVLMPTGMFHLTIDEYVNGYCKTAFIDKEVQKEKNNIAFLFEQFENWQKAEKARQFVAAIKRRIHDSGEISKDQEKWLLWAEHILTLEDPVAKAIELSKTPKIEDELTKTIDALAINNFFKICSSRTPCKLEEATVKKLLASRSKFT